MRYILINLKHTKILALMLTVSRIRRYNNGCSHVPVDSIFDISYFVQNFRVSSRSTLSCAEPSSGTITEQLASLSDVLINDYYFISLILFYARDTSDSFRTGSSRERWGLNIKSASSDDVLLLPRLPRRSRIR